MIMKKIIYSLVAAVALLCSLTSHAQQSERLFPYPEAPETITNFYERCTYLVDKFWERCNFKSAFSSKSKLNDAFGDWVSFMPYASADTVHLAVDRLLETVKKSGPQTLEIARMAERWLYSDSADFVSEEVYLPFAKAAAGHKKIPSDDRSHFARQVNIIANSAVGATFPDIELTGADGTKRHALADSTKYTLVLVASRDCSDCSLARVRLSADPALNSLVDAKLLKIVYIVDGDAGDTDKSDVSSCPANWVAGVAGSLGDTLEMRGNPMIYYLDKDNKIMVKNIPVDNVLNAFSALYKLNN